MTGSGYHRKCHMAYTPLIKAPKQATPRANHEQYAERDYDVEQECSNQKQYFIKYEAPVKGKRGQNVKQDKHIHDHGSDSPLEHVVECYIDKNYCNTPVDVDFGEKTTAVPIKETNFDVSDEKPVQDQERMDWNNYHRLEVIHKFMDDLEYDYPSLCTTGVIGTSIEGRNLKILKISNSNASNAAVWVDAGIHAREWIAPAVNTYLANHIARNFDTLPESIKNKDWYFLPVINPDGYEYSHTKDRMWRKNRAWHGGQCVGVDLNRNFSLGWGGKGSSEQPTNSFYRGPKPFSEPESSAMRDVFMNSGIKFKVYITLHSYGQVIIFPYAYSSELPPDYVRLLEGATAMSKAIYNSNGNTYKVGISRDVMYGAAGTSNDYSHGIVGIPYCYLIELRSKKHKFRLPKEEIEETCNEILSCVKALMEFVDTYKCKSIPIDPEEEVSDSELKNSDSEVRRNDSSEKKSDSYVKNDYSVTHKGDAYVDRTESYMRVDESFVNLKDSILNTNKNECNLFKVAPPVPNTQVWEVQFSREGQRHFVKTLDTLGGAYSNDSFNLGGYLVKSLPPKKLYKCSMSNQLKMFIKHLRRKSNEEDMRVVSNDDIFGGILFFMVHFIRAAKRRQSINIWNEERSTMDIMVEGPRAAQVAGMLHEREIPYSIAIPDITTLLEREQGAAVSKTIRRNSTATRNTMDWKAYHRLDTIYAFLDNLAVEYPYLCSVSVIGKSVEGRELKMLKISNGNESNTGVWLDGAIHPREWISPAVVTYIADQIVRTFHEQPDSVTNKDWYILPVMNPDGYEYTHTHDRMWRKNRARYGECIGVDLNRNFSYGFGEKGEEGSSDDPGNIFYRGPKAFSEPETAAVRRTIVGTPTTFKVFLSFHSYGEVIIFPWGYTSEPCPDYVELLEGGTAMAKAIHGTNGHTYKVGSTKDLMYYAAGTSIDWSYAVTNIPYSYMVELKGKTHRFLLPKEEIITTASEVLNGVLRLMDFVDRRCSGTQSCPCPK